jgi:hypothetical protein
VRGKLPENLMRVRIYNGTDESLMCDPTKICQRYFAFWLTLVFLSLCELVTLALPFLCRWGMGVERGLGLGLVRLRYLEAVEIDLAGEWNGTRSPREKRGGERNMTRLYYSV